MKTITLMIIGNPSPPFLMIAPRGAPMKKKIMQMSDRVNLLMASMSCCLIILSPSLVIILLNSKSLTSC